MSARVTAAIAVAGALFACGLALAGVTRPRVILDAFSLTDWNPRLWLMFAGAQLVARPATALLVRRGTTLLGRPLAVQPRRRIDRSLIVGSLVFGVGWGLAGICPGPAFASVASGGVHVALAFAGMWAGIVLHDARQPPRS